MTDSKQKLLNRRLVLETHHRLCSVLQSAGKRAQNQAASLLERLPSRLHSVLRILRRAYITYITKRATQASASLAYYALFSLFPLLLFLISIGSFFLKPDEVQTQVISLVVDVVPTAGDLVAQNIAQVLESRGAVSVAAVVSLLWSATGFFVGLMRNIERAWDGVKRRSVLKSRLVAMLGVAVLAVLLYIVAFGSGTFNILTNLGIPGMEMLNEVPALVTALLSRVFHISMLVIVVAALYKWVPQQRPSWASAVISTVISVAGMFGITVVYRWYLGSGLSRYSLVYGSLGTVMGLMVWIYTCCIILLFGAHLCSAIQRQQNLKAHSAKEPAH